MIGFVFLSDWLITRIRIHYFLSHHGMIVGFEPARKYVL